MAYILRDKDPKTLRDAFKIVVNIENNRRASSKLGKRNDPKNLRDSFKITVNIENNRRASGKLGKRDDPKLFNPRHNKRDRGKPVANNKNEEGKIDQVIRLLKNLNPQGLNNNKANNANDRS